jgi:hypothetical protein
MGGPRVRFGRPSNGVRKMTLRARRWIPRASFLLGFVLVAGVAFAGRVPAGEGPAFAALALDAGATGGLAAEPEGRLLRAPVLTAGAPGPRARVTLLNQTSGSVAVLVRARSAGRDLDRALTLELRAGRRPLRATLGELRRWRPLALALRSQRRRTVAVRAFIPASAGGYEARAADVTLEFLRKGARQ